MTGAVHWKWEDFCTPEQLQEVHKNGYGITEVNDGFRTIVKTDIAILDELDRIDQKKLLTAIDCPTLLIHGNGDPLESSFLEISKQGFSLLPEGSEIIVIPGATHAFKEHADEVVDVTMRWYAEYFPIAKEKGA
jgi:pimeloyl-ACP methyl ester carboxylesterase